MFLLAGLVWCGNCQECIGIRADRRAGEVPKDFYRCRGRRIRARCDLPHGDRASLDEAVREHFTRHFVDAVDVQATIEAQREQHPSIRSERAVVLRDELAQGEAELAEATSFRSCSTTTTHTGPSPLSSGHPSKLSSPVASGTPRQLAQTCVVASLRSSRTSSRATSTGCRPHRHHPGDGAGAAHGGVHTGAGAEPAAARGLRRVPYQQSPQRGRQRLRIVVEPRSGSTGCLGPKVQRRPTLDFADDDARGIEVVDYLEPAFRRVDLTDGLITYSS